MLPQNLVLQNKLYKLFYQSCDCPKTNSRSLVRDRVIDQMLITQLQEAIQESYGIISDHAGNPLILTHFHNPVPLHLLNK